MNQINVSLRHMRAFTALVRHGNFRRAAQSLNLSQSALSMTIQQMERELGVALFDRTTRRVELTTVGSNLLPTIDRILGDIDMSMADARAEAEGQRGRVVVASTLSIAVRNLPTVIQRFRAKYPNIRVSTLDYTVSAIHHSLRVNESDIGICGQNEFDSELDFEFLKSDRLEAILTREHPLAKQSEIRWQELLSYPFVAMSRGTQIRDLIDAGLRRRRLTVNPVCESTQPVVIEAMVEARLGISALPKATLASNNDRLCRRQLCDPVIERRLGLLSRKGRSLSPAAAAFRTELLRYMKDEFGR